MVSNLNDIALTKTRMNGVPMGNLQPTIPLNVRSPRIVNLASGHQNFSLQT
jgi:hypothetical protein